MRDECKTINVQRNDKACMVQILRAVRHDLYITPKQSYLSHINTRQTSFEACVDSKRKSRDCNVLPLTRMYTWWLFQSIWRSRSIDALALAILICISSSMRPLLGIVLQRYVNSRTAFRLFPSTMISSSRVLVELGWYSTSVFFGPNFFDEWEKACTIFCISSAEWATSALSFANSSSVISIRVFLFFALKCAILVC